MTLFLAGVAVGVFVTAAAAWRLTLKRRPREDRVDLRGRIYW